MVLLTICQYLGGKRTLHEAIIIDLAIDGIVFTAHMYLVDDESVQHEFLLGHNVIVQPDILFKVDNGHVKFERKNGIQRRLIVSTFV